MKHAAIIGLFLLGGCAGNADKLAMLEQERPVEDLYNDALDASQQGNWITAAKLFEEVERQHPYSEWATRAQLLYAHTLYQDLRYDEAVIALDRFIDLNPAHSDVDYAFYLKALCFYEQISDVGRDQKMTEDALANLEQVIRRFPESKYARDARLKIDLTNDHLAGKEMEIGRFYLNKKLYVAAINRFRAVIETYQTTTHTAEALHRLTEAYLALGLNKEAQRNAAVLGHNYPGSDWYQYSYRLLERAGLTDA